MSASVDARREQTLRELAGAAMGEVGPEECLEEPLLALIRSGDQADDLGDAIQHVAGCPACRARLTEGTLGRKEFVVVAIEAPRGSQAELERAVAATRARLFARGTGRWTAVVEAERADQLRAQLDKPDSSVVHRLAIGTPFEVPVEALRAARSELRRTTMNSDIPPLESGTDAAEVQAWVQIAKKPRQRVWSFSPGWLIIAVLAIGAAMGIAYLFATHLGEG